ncbi:MAG: hypothetical protein Q9208_004935 [Pyrenodesmia sp. 3 TL-2023]
MKGGGNPATRIDEAGSSKDTCIPLLSCRNLRRKLAFACTLPPTKIGPAITNSMFVNPLLALTAAGGSLKTTPSHLGSDSPILCYNPSYASIRPFFPDCQQLITRHISPESADLTPIVFAHRSGSRPRAFVVPREWRVGTCVVAIDVRAGDSREVETWGAVKKAAIDVLLTCVAGGDGLGGFVMTGEAWGLLVEVRGFGKGAAGVLGINEGAE